MAKKYTVWVLNDNGEIIDSIYRTTIARGAWVAVRWRGHYHQLFGGIRGRAVWIRASRPVGKA
jgi:hypothetical protein